MLDHQVYKSFIDYIRDVKRLSSHTVTSYDRDLEQCATFLYEQYGATLCDATHTMIRTWVVALVDDQLTPASINRKLSALRSFYRYAKARKKVTTSPVAKIPSLKSSKRLPVTARVEEVERLLDLLDKGPAFEDSRDHAIIMLLFTCGLRRSELLAIQETDIDFGRAVIRVEGKGSKERLAPLLPIASRALKRYVNERRLLSTTNIKLFVQADGSPLSDRQLYQMVKDRFTLVSTQNNISPHKLRHTFATYLLNQGADLLAVKELLGHASLAATQVYTHNDINALRRAYRGAHPRS